MLAQMDMVTKLIQGWWIPVVIIMIPAAFIIVVRVMASRYKTMIQAA